MSQNQGGQVPGHFVKMDGDSVTATAVEKDDKGIHCLLKSVFSSSQHSYAGIEKATIQVRHDKAACFIKSQQKLKLFPRPSDILVTSIFLILWVFVNEKLNSEKLFRTALRELIFLPLEMSFP